MSLITHEAPGGHFRCTFTMAQGTSPCIYPLAQLSLFVGISSANSHNEVGGQT